MQQKSISIGLFILSMLGAYLLLSMLTIFVNNSVHGDSTISESGLKESFSESALLVESLPKPCEPHEVEEGKVCIGLYFDSSDHVTTSILTADGNVEQLLPISGSSEAERSEAKQSSGATSMADEKANKSDRQAHVSSEQEEPTETTSQKSSDKIESPCVYVANNLYDHETNDEDELIYSSDKELTDDNKTEYVWIDPDQPDIKDEYFGNREDGVCVELYRDNGDGIADPSDDMFVGFTLMMDNSRSESESYQFTNLPDGDYFAKFYPLGAEGSKSEEVIKTPTAQTRSEYSEPTPSTTIDIMSNDRMIKNETKYNPNETNVNDNKNLVNTNTTTNVRPTSSSNTTNRNTQAESQYDTQSNSQSSTDKSNVNNSSAPAGSNSNTTEYNHNNGVEANRSDDNYSSNYNNSASTEYSEQNSENSRNITASPTAEVIYEPTAEVVYEEYNDSTYSESSDYESQDATNQSTTDTYNTDTSTYSDSEPAVDRTNEEVEQNQNKSADKALSSIQIQINPSNPDSSSPSTSHEENPTSNENQSVDEGTNSESNNEVHQFQPVEPDSESTPYPAPDESSSSNESGLSSITGLGLSIGSEVGSDAASADEDTTP